MAVETKGRAPWKNESGEAVLLEVRDLTISFRRYEAGLRMKRICPVNGLCLRAEKGKITAVVGESGSGKSLLAHALLGVLPENADVSGQILWKGQRLDADGFQALRGKQIGLIPQRVSYLDPLMKVGKQLTGGRKEKMGQAEALLARYGLSREVMERYPHELSGGMVRRVLTASVTMEDVECLIADEPTPGLHTRAAEELAAHFRQLAEEGKGILLITHDLQLALEIADCLVVFYEGKAVDQMRTAAFLDGSGCRHPFTRKLREVYQQTFGFREKGEGDEERWNEI